jgi:membrane-bound serine protease (ClpP class)
MLTLGGVAALTFGFMMLFDTEEIPALRVPLGFVLPTAITIGLVMGGVTLMVVVAHRARVVTGAEGLAGEIGEAITDIAGSGKVFVHGEYWNATSVQPIASGAKVRVKTVHQLGLEVERADS